MAGVVAAVLVAAAVGTAGYLYRTGPARLANSTPPPAAGPAQAPGARTPLDAEDPSGQSGSGSVPSTECRYDAVSAASRADGEIAPTPPNRTQLSGPVRVRLGTNQGPIVLELNATAAPCTVNSFVNLARAGYFGDSSCHRLTTEKIFVLQCGDPTGTGSGTPGYRFDDENLPTGVTSPYTRGTVAMANAGPNTNGSQFFLVYKDSAIDPNYPIFGRVTEGLDLLDRIAAGGAANGDGTPNIEVIIDMVDVA
jgi:peptidyl-prolyl cis-trans isomerase B (cyclophilin B)